MATPSYFPGRLRELRLASGKTQRFLAEELGVSAATFRRYEQGQALIPDEHTERLANLFGVSAEWLMGALGGAMA